MLSALGALVLGIAFGFALQRGSFCGSSLLSSVVLYRDWKGPVAILVAILVSMVGFAVLAHLGWVIPNPSPLRLMPAVVGGLVFGTGMVLAGGCITGTLYKAAEGRLTSMLALVTTGIGSASVKAGALASVGKVLQRMTAGFQWHASLDEAAGVGYPLAAAIVGVAGLVTVLVVSLVRGRSSWRPPGVKMLTTAGWSPVTAGAIIGILGWIAYVLSGAAGRNYPLGALGGVDGAFSLLTAGESRGTVWLVALAGGILAGSALSARLRGGLKLRSADPGTLLVALLGGLLLGVGASIGRGCFIGNGVSGLALLSVHSVVFTACMVAANWVTTLLYLRGIR